MVDSETYPQDLAENWAAVEQYDYLIGDFMWTAWDYLGEVGLGAWTYEADGAGFAKPYPWLLADSGAFDILGNDNAEAGLARAVWDKNAPPYIGVVPVNRDPEKLLKAIWRDSNAIPSWSWSGCEGRPATVEVYSGADSVELFLNGESVGKQALSGCKAVFETVYAPGELKAVAYHGDGSVQSESALRSADAPLRLEITPENAEGDILYFDMSLRGSNGEVACGRDAVIQLVVEGGELLAFGSANPRTAESFLSGRYTTYYGRAQAVVRPTAKKVFLKASGSGFEAETAVSAKT